MPVREAERGKDNKKDWQHVGIRSSAIPATPDEEIRHGRRSMEIAEHAHLF